MHVGKKLNYHLNDFNQLLLGAFVVVIEAQKLEVCIHKDNCMVEKRSEIQFTNMSDDTANIFIMNCGIRLKIHSSLRCKNSNYEFEAISCSSKADD